MTPLDHAAWELRDLIDRADSMLRRAEDANRALQRGSPAGKDQNPHFRAPLEAQVMRDNFGET